MSLNLLFFFKVALVILNLLFFYINFGIFYYVKKNPAGIGKLFMIFKNLFFLDIPSKQLHQNGKTTILKVQYGESLLGDLQGQNFSNTESQIRVWHHQDGNTSHFKIQLPRKKTNEHLSIFRHHWKKSQHLGEMMRLKHPVDHRDGEGPQEKGKGVGLHWPYHPCTRQGTEKHPLNL